MDTKTFWKFYPVLINFPENYIRIISFPFTVFTHLNKAANNSKMGLSLPSTPTPDYPLSNSHTPHPVEIFHRHVLKNLNSVITTG